MKPEEIPNLVELLYVQLIKSVFDDPERLRRAALESMRVLSVADVAYLLGIKDVKTIKAWHNAQKAGFRMRVGPDGDLTMRVQDFEEWYARAYKMPPPKVRL